MSGSSGACSSCFGVLPSEMRARRMTDREYLYCAAQLLLDEQEKLEAMCPRAGRRQNGGFVRCAASRFRRKTQDLMKDGLRS